MDTVIKAVAAYVVLWLVMRIAGRRSVGQLTTFDLILLLIIGGVMARAVMGPDYSLTNAILVLVTLVIVDVGLSLLERGRPNVAKFLKGVPTVLVEDGKPIEARLRRARVTIDEILTAARTRHGIIELGDIKLAVLESNGDISIVPRERR